MLVVANGHNEEAKWPDPPYPGDFDGRQLHALDYARRRGVPRPERARRRHGQQRDGHRHRHLARRRPHLPVGAPRQLGDPEAAARPARRPDHQAVGGRPRAVADPPAAVAAAAADHRRAARALRPAGAERGLFQYHPTITDTVLSRISHGEITPKPGIDALDGDGVRSPTAASEPVDAIVWCTGYRVSIPFLDDGAVGPDPHELPLYKRIFHLDARDLFFVGLMQSTGSAFPIVERQAQIVAEHLAGDWALPSPREMRARRERKRRGTRSRAGASTGGRRCASTSTATCTSSASELEAGRGHGRPREPARRS